MGDLLRSWRVLLVRLSARLIVGECFPLGAIRVVDGKNGGGGGDVDGVELSCRSRLSSRSRLVSLSERSERSEHCVDETCDLSLLSRDDINWYDAIFVHTSDTESLLSFQDTLGCTIPRAPLDSMLVFLRDADASCAADWSEWNVEGWRCGAVRFAGHISAHTREICVSVRDPLNDSDDDGGEVVWRVVGPSSADVAEAMKAVGDKFPEYEFLARAPFPTRGLPPGTVYPTYQRTVDMLHFCESAVVGGGAVSLETLRQVLRRQVVAKGPIEVIDLSEEEE